MGQRARHRVAIIRQPPEYEPALVSESVRAALDAIGMPVRALVKPGDRVVLKPNFIRQSHTTRPDEWQQIITHGTIIATMARDVAAAMGGRGTITIADAPQTDSDFDKICALTELPALRDELARDFPELAFEILDLRREVWRTRDGVIVERRKLPEDPRGYTLVDLADDSCFVGKQGRFYGADYDTKFTESHHSGGRHEYLLSRSVMDADVFINLPKLKTHKKVGVTLSLKNLVGINGDKNYLPHFSIGTPGDGGDEFPDSRIQNRVQSKLISAFKSAAKSSPWWGPAAKRVGSRIFGETNAVVRSGNWHGNDTTWRMVLDLNRALLEYDGAGHPRREPLRYLSIIDGIVAGEGDGPMEADAKPCGVVIAGTHPVATDFAAAGLMGLDWQRLPTIREGLRVFGLTPGDIEADGGESFRFVPHFGWKGHVEAG